MVSRLLMGYVCLWIESVVLSGVGGAEAGEVGIRSRSRTAERSRGVTLATEGHRGDGCAQIGRIRKKSGKEAESEAGVGKEDECPQIDRRG